MEAAERAAGAGEGRLEPPRAQPGTDLTRLLALSDGVFAFAMTLLVLGLALLVGFDPARIGTVLFNLRGAFLAYALSFFVIWIYWVAHNQVFAYVRSYDRRLQQLNVVFLLFIAVMPFVTNLLAAASGQLLAVVGYALVQIAAGSALSAVWFYATHGRRHVPPTLPESWVRYTAVRSAIGPIVFAVSIPLALLNPALGEYSWVSLFIVQAVVRHGRARPDPEGPEPGRP